MKKHNYLPDEHHVMRHVPRKVQERDEEGNLLGFWPAAFAHRNEEEYLSVNWLEYFNGTHFSNASNCKTALQGFLKGKQACFGVAQVGRVKEISKSSSKPVRIVYYPSPENPSHSAIFFDHPTPDTGREDLAREFFKEHY